MRIVIGGASAIVAASGLLPYAVDVETREFWRLGAACYLKSTSAVFRGLRLGGSWVTLSEDFASASSRGWSDCCEHPSSIS